MSFHFKPILLCPSFQPTVAQQHTHTPTSTLSLRPTFTNRIVMGTIHVSIKMSINLQLTSISLA